MDENIDTKETSDKAIETALDRAPSLIALLTITLLVMSVSHEWGYFWIVGSQFQTFVSTVDYLANGVLWLPAGLFFIYGNIEWWRFKKQDRPKKNWKDWKTWRWPAFVFVSYAVIFSLAEWPPDIFISFNILVVLIFVWSRIWESVFPLSKFREPYGTITRETLRSVPPVMVGMAIWGLINAVNDLSASTSPYIISFKPDPQSHELRIFLRTFEKGILLKNPATNRVEFYKWDEVSAISKPVPDQSRSLLCYWFEICPKRLPPTIP